jgi:cell division protein FtsI/penicillin-binding protein 2
MARYRTTSQVSDTHRKRMFSRRIEIVHGILLVILLVIVARLIELQIIRGAEYEEIARAQHFGGIVLPAKRGEILSRNSKTNELNILATNTTLDLLYVDPFVTDDKSTVSRLLAEELLITEYDNLCREGDKDCPRELREYYESAFDPLKEINNQINESDEGESNNRIILPIETIRGQFSNDIFKRINEEFVSFIPLLYGANKVQVRKIQEFGIPGIYASENSKLVYANPVHIPQYERHRIAKIISPSLALEPEFIRERLVKRRLRYVPIMRRIKPEFSKRIKSLKKESIERTAQQRKELIKRGDKETANNIYDPLRGIALIPEHWRIYPDGTVASQIAGFLNINQQPQNGIERTFDHDLRGQEGRISALTDPFGGQIVSDDQSIIHALDGRSVILTIDRFLQKKVENILSAAVDEFEADSGQVIVMDPSTGRIIVAANAPLVDANNYSLVFKKEPYDIPDDLIPSIVVEIADPETNDLVMRGYLNDATPEGRVHLSRELQEELLDLEKYYDIDDLKRYFLYTGENNRFELFLERGNDGDYHWLRYKNRIGVGAYINRISQEIYEPGSVFKPITMSIAIDQGEITPDDMYLDEGTVEIDEYIIANAENRVFDEVTMTDCLSYSVNTCMTHVSRKLGKKLFANYIKRFGFGRITGIQLEDEKPGNVLDWRRWSDALLATASYGQGISATPLQIVTAFSVLANGGKLVKPTIIDSWIDSDGTIEEVYSKTLEQVITEEAAATVTAMLTKGMNEGFARAAKVDGYRMAGKTGTSQIAGPGGKYESTGSGSSITSFAGYAPVDKPRFVMIVKFDRPRTVEYGSQSAAPVFKEVSKVLFDYYGIPPDEK